MSLTYLYLYTNISFSSHERSVMSGMRTTAISTSAPPAVETLWSNFWNHGRTDADRNALMEHYLPLARFAAVRLATRHGRRARGGDVDDLLQYGVFGLRDAIGKFDPARGVKFETYCLQRIRGAMLDG